MRDWQFKGVSLRTFGNVASILIATAALTNASEAFAWGAGAHRLVSESAWQSLPAEIPEFLRTPEAGRQIAEVSRQPDWAKAQASRTIRIPIRRILSLLETI